MSLERMKRLPATESFRPGEKIVAEEILAEEILAADGVKEI